MDSIKISGNTYTETDGLDYCLSANGDTGPWSDPIQAFRGTAVGYTQSSPISEFRHIIPTQYLTDGFKIRFIPVGMTVTGKYCNVDNIRVQAMQPPNNIQFFINSQQVSYTSGSNPQPQMGGLLSPNGNNNIDKIQVLETFLGTQHPLHMVSHIHAKPMSLTLLKLTVKAGTGAIRETGSMETVTLSIGWKDPQPWYSELHGRY